MVVFVSTNLALLIFLGLSVLASAVCLMMITDHLILKISYLLLVIMGFLLMYMGKLNIGIITLVLINILTWAYALWVSGNSTKEFR